MSRSREPDHHQGRQVDLGELGSDVERRAAAPRSSAMARGDTAAEIDRTSSTSAGPGIGTEARPGSPQVARSEPGIDALARGARRNAAARHATRPVATPDRAPDRARDGRTGVGGQEHDARRVTCEAPRHGGAPRAAAPSRPSSGRPPPLRTPRGRSQHLEQVVGQPFERVAAASRRSTGRGHAGRSRCTRWGRTGSRNWRAQTPTPRVIPWIEHDRRTLARLDHVDAPTVVRW